MEIQNDSLTFSRLTIQSPKNKSDFLEMHAHDFYELIIYVNGNVDYVTDNFLTKPQPYSVVWFCPGQMHTATLLSESKYERYVLYFSKDFLLCSITFLL